MLDARPGTGHVGAVPATLMLCALIGPPRIARAQVDASSGAFSCVAEAAAFIQQHSVGEIRAERDRRLALRGDPDEPATVTAHRWCVVAELMRVLGDDGAATLFARAIASTRDPGYELRLADYFRNARGPRSALFEQAERHYRAALDGVHSRATAPGISDDAIAERATRGLMLMYQEDGLTLLPRKGPHGREAPRPSISVMVGARVAMNTNDTPIDASSRPQVDDARRFTAEAMFAASMLRKAQPLRKDELQAIARAPLRNELMVRGRVRTWPIGAFDLWYRHSQIHDGEITNFRLPDQRNDVVVSELGAGIARALDASPAFDLALAGDYRRVHRVGVVESAPDQAQDFDMFRLRPSIARFVGPDKLSLVAAHVVMMIPDIEGGVIVERARGRMITSLDVDYALNRLLLVPHQLPAVRVFAGVAEDDETFGTRTVRRRDAHLGFEVPRLSGWDLHVQGSLFSGAVDVRAPDPAQLSGQDPQQRQSQYRTTLVLLRRLIDEDARSGLPPATLGVRPSVLNAVITMRHDVAIRGLAAYDNVRGGVELAAKVLTVGAAGTAIFFSAGYDNQYFYSIGKDLHIVHLDMRMGW